MRYNPDIHNRRSMRLQGYDYSKAGGYFITICTYKRKCLFGEIMDGKMVKSEWLKISRIRENITLDEFIIMPNHLHGIIIISESDKMIHHVGAIRRIAPTNNIKNPIGPKPGSIGAIMGQFKSITTKHINKIRNTQRTPVWQRNYYEHIIRDENELNQIREYILSNPMKWSEDTYYL
ncbi:transposase [bacterium]|nr:transposase [bacterium]RQV95282.1 MAG: transposase [bacterium]